MTLCIRWTVVVFALVSIAGFTAHAQDVSLVVQPGTILQGDPVMIQVQDAATVEDIQALTLNGKSLPVFMYRNIPTALIGIPLAERPGDYTLRATLKSGQTIEKIVTVAARTMPKKPLGIPAKLGGNTKASAKKLVSTLVQDNKNLKRLTTASTMLWTNAFAPPVANAVVTDAYGYARQTGGYLISHLGTDFHAVAGTPVMAMNDGIVRKAKWYRTYGNTIVVDHGLGVSTFYMHLSKMRVAVGDVVTKGQLIGLAGTTGYSEGPHLHISVHIQDAAIDPMRFLDLLK